MSEFKDFARRANTPPEPNVEGSFECQWCYVEVDGAFYDPTAKRLAWECPEGHKSMIEEFSL